MINNSSQRIFSSKYAPNPDLNLIWMDLTSDPDGGILRVWKNNEYVKITQPELIGNGHIISNGTEFPQRTRLVFEEVDIIDDPSSDSTRVRAIKGKDGSVGPQGPAGQSIQGPTGPRGLDGSDGSDGKSAYESARDGGYTNDEQTFNYDLSTVSSKQNVIDQDLNTSNKSIVGAINELILDKENVGVAQSKINTHQSIYDHTKIFHANREALDSISGVNTGDQDLSGYSLTSHNHLLSELHERSYNSLTDKPNLSLLEDVIDIQYFSEAEPSEPQNGELWYSPITTELYAFDSVSGFIIIDFQWKIYINKDESSTDYGKLYIYAGNSLVIVPDALALGETSTTAFDGERGKTAYDHSQITGNPHGTTASDVGASSLGHNHLGEGINPDVVLINKAYTDAESVALSVGSLFYNSDQQDWMLKTSSDTYSNYNGEISPLMKNVDTTTHLNGQPVFVFTGTGKFPNVKLANSGSLSTGFIIALATQDVLHTGNARGRYCAFGSVGGVPISNVIKTGESSALWVEGARLYLSNETGKLTTVENGFYVGIITDKSGSNINIFAHPSMPLAPDLSSNSVSIAPSVKAIVDALALKANIANPVFTGIVKAPTYQDALGNSPFVLQNGGTIYHTTVWITGTTVSTSTNRLIKTGGSNFTAAMVGAKIIVSGEERIISAFVDINTVDASVNFSQNYSGVSFSVFGRKIYQDGNNLLFSPYNDPNKGFGMNNSGGLTAYSGLTAYGFSVIGSSDFNGKFGYSDVYFIRNAAGVFEINNGTAGTYRDLILRNLLGTTAKIGTVYETRLTTATTGAAITSISVDHTTNFPATGIIAFVPALSVEKITQPINISTGWATYLATINNANQFTTSGVNGSIYKSVLTVGKAYKMKITASCSIGTCRIQMVGGTTIYSFTGSVTDVEVFFTANNSNIEIVGASNGAVVTISSISVLEDPVYSINYTSKTSTSIVFASTAIPAYAAGTAILVTSAGGYTEIESDGTIKFNGSATVFDDLTGDITRTKTTGTRVTLNDAENRIDYTNTATTTDYLFLNYQISHKWKVGSIIYPHIHFEQAENNIPNFVIQYRWQVNGGIKTTAWTNYKCGTTAFTYSTGTLNQISHDSGITPPVGATLSDIIQIRVIRDTANSLGLYSGADPYTATVGITSVDIHYEMDTLGSRSEYAK